MTARPRAGRVRPECSRENILRDLCYLRLLGNLEPRAECVFVLAGRLTLRPHRSCASSPGPREGITIVWTGRRFGFPRDRCIVVGHHSGEAFRNRNGLLGAVP